MSRVTASLEEARGKALARRTGSGYEATHRGKAAKKAKARYLHRTMRRISDRHKREGGCVIPGEICTAAVVLLTSRGVRMAVQKSAEAIVGAVLTEGPNMSDRD